MIRVTVEDLETGDTDSKVVPMDDYFILTTGSAQASTQVYGNGTHVITVKGRKP